MSGSFALKTLTALSDLHPNMANLKIIGIVIGKTDVKGFPDRKNIGAERYTVSFTVRDSPAHFVNVASWGSEDYIRSLSDSFRVGECLIIENPLVQRKEMEREEKFSPATPSNCKLLLSENHSIVKVCSSYEVDAKLLSLIHLPVKESHDYYSLGDIVANGQNLDGKIINVLAAVRSVGEPKCFTTSDGRRGQRCEVKLYDETEPSFAMLCWDHESVLRAQSWMPRETVIFASDVRISFDKFRNCMTATVISKSIITANPDTPEANILLNFIRENTETSALENEIDAYWKDSVNFAPGKAEILLSPILDFTEAQFRTTEALNSKVPKMDVKTVYDIDRRKAKDIKSTEKNGLIFHKYFRKRLHTIDLPPSCMITNSAQKVLHAPPKVSTIVEVYTVKQLKVKALKKEGKADPFYGILYAYISTLSLDDQATSVVRNRCLGCGYIVNEASNACSTCNKDSAAFPSIFPSFDLLVDLTDHTGTLPSCSLTGRVAEETLGCTVNEFLAMTEEQKTALKWQFLLERSKIYFKLVLSHRARGGFRVSVLSCKLADPTEASKNLAGQGNI